MKMHLISIRFVIIAALLIIFCSTQNLSAQEKMPTIYMEITKLKKTNDDLMDMHDELMKPYIQERIKQGNQLAHAMFRVRYPYSDNAEYDYIALDVYNDFNHLHLGQQKMMEIAHTVFPHANVPKMIERYEAAAQSTSSEVFVIRDEAFPGPNGASDKPAKFVQVNHMKVDEMKSWDYVKMESEIFKPIHQERGKAGDMHDWILLQRVMPHGSEWDDNFITFDIYNEWGDMAGHGIGNLMKKVHPDKDAETIWEKMTNMRELRRSETWELIAFVKEPTPDITYTTVKEGSGAHPMRGQEVAWRGQLTSEAGEVLLNTQTLGFDFYATLGDNPYDRYFEKGLMQMKKGGVMKMNVPAAAQDKQTLGATGGKTAVMKIELVDVGTPKPNGAKMLKKKIEKYGLSVAKEKYIKLQADNPKGYVFREGDMNNLGYELMADGNTQAAIYIFDLNQKNYPKSWNACDSLADGYKAAGNYAKAKHCYKMALQLNPEFTAAKDKLDKL